MGPGEWTLAGVRAADEKAVGCRAVQSFEARALCSNRKNKTLK